MCLRREMLMVSRKGGFVGLCSTNRPIETDLSGWGHRGLGHLARLGTEYTDGTGNGQPARRRSQATAPGSRCG